MYNDFIIKISEVLIYYIAIINYCIVLLRLIKLRIKLKTRREDTNDDAVSGVDVNG